MQQSTAVPSDQITREQAMTMIARAMKITGLESTLTDSEISPVLTGYTDAEVAVIVERLLEKSKLI